MAEGDGSTTEWTRIAQTLNTVGQVLQIEYGEQGIPTKKLIEAAEQLGDYAKGSLRPSDYCCNVTNNDPCSFVHHIFERLNHGHYRYLGFSFPYDGEILWKPKDKKEQQRVGEWMSGCYRLDEDPRQL